jgi:uncharacterized membrane protein YpjA
MLGTPWVAWTLAAINFTAAVLGYIYWYGDKILGSPWYLWPFVPDSPLSATLMGAAILALHKGRRWDLLGLFAATGSIKYGAWTLWVWFTNYLSGGGYSLQALVMSLSHFGMIALGVALLPAIRIRLSHVALVALWFGLNDILDYRFGTRPPIPNPHDIGSIELFAVLTTVVLVACWLILSRREYTRPSA